MKTFLCLVCVLVGGSLVRADISQSGSGGVQITVDSEAKDLARGYAAAFSQLSRPPLTLVFQKEGTLRTLEDVKQVRASEGVLIVEVGKGIIYIINPKDVVYLTDGAQLQKKP